MVTQPSFQVDTQSSSCRGAAMRLAHCVVLFGSPTRLTKGTHAVLRTAQRPEPYPEHG
jgi:hypothetical protein